MKKKTPSWAKKSAGRIGKSFSALASGLKSLKPMKTAARLKLPSVSPSFVARCLYQVKSRTRHLTWANWPSG